MTDNPLFGQRFQGGRYVLWSVLLGLSIAALVLWETPKSSGTAKLAVSCRPQGLPAGCRVKAWVGPRSKWAGAAWDGEGAWSELPANTGEIVFPPVAITVGYRRWVKNYIPRKTSDLLVLRFQAPAVAPRYFVLPLGADWIHGSFRTDRQTGIRADITWDGLWQDPSAFKAMR